MINSILPSELTLVETLVTIGFFIFIFIFILFIYFCYSNCSQPIWGIINQMTSNPIILIKPTIQGKTNLFFVTKIV